MANARTVVVKLLEEKTPGASLSGDLKYRTKVKEVAVYNRGNDLDAVDTSARVTWTLDLEARSWGVKDAGVYLLEVAVGWTFLDVTKDTRAEPTQLTWTPASKDGWSAQVEAGEKTLPFSIFPAEVEVYLLEKKIVVKF